MFKSFFSKKVKDIDKKTIDKIILVSNEHIGNDRLLNKTFGIRIYDSSIAPFAKQGDQYPLEGSYTFSTTTDFQDQITLEFHWSYESKATHESYLGTLRIQGYKLEKAEGPMVRVHYLIDDNQIAIWATNDKNNSKLSFELLKNAEGEVVH